MYYGEASRGHLVHRGCTRILHKHLPCYGRDLGFYGFLPSEGSCSQFPPDTKGQWHSFLFVMSLYPPPYLKFKQSEHFCTNIYFCKCAWGWLAHVCGSPWRPEESVGALEAGVTSSCVGAGNWAWVLCKSGRCSWLLNQSFTTDFQILMVFKFLGGDFFFLYCIGVHTKNFLPCVDCELSLSPERFTILHFVSKSIARYGGAYV